MRRPVEAYVELVLRHRLAVVLILLLVTGVAGWICTRAVISSSLAGIFFGNSPRYLRYVERAKEFGSDDFIVVAFEDEDLLGEKTLGRLDKALRRIEVLPDVGRVSSLLDAQRMSGDADTLLVEGYADAALEAPERRRELLEALRTDPLMGDLFVSKDGRATAVAVELAPDPDRPAERVPQLVRDVFGAFEEAGFPADGLHRAGFPVVVSEVVEQTYFNMSRIFPFSLVILLVAVWVMFRRFLPVLITGGVALIAVVWMMAFSVLLDRHVTIMASGMPAIILIIAFSDVIHLCSAYLTEVTNGHPRDRAVRRSCTEVGAACMLTSITTFFGFISMSLVPAPAFRILGMSLGFGVGVALLLAMTVTPVLLSWLPEPKPWRRGAAGGVQGALDRLLELCARLATDRPVLVTVAFGLLLLASGVGMSLLTIETEFAKRLSGDNRVNQDAVWLDERLAGSHVLEVYVETEEDGGLLAPDAFVKIAALQDGTGEVKGVDRTLSLVDLVREVHRHVAPPGTPAERGIPTTPGALAQYLLLFEMSGGERLDQLVDFGRRSMRISVRLEDGRFREAARIGEEVRRLAKETLGEGLTVEPAGLQYLLGDWLDELLAGQRRGLGFAFGAVALMMILGLASLRTGLWSMVPNTLPLVALGGLLGLCWDSVDSDVAGVAMIAIGIGVDDTIHYLMRLRVEWDRQETVADAIRAAMHYAGRGIVITTVILVLGFAPFALSDYVTLLFFGTLLPYCLVVALLADVLLVPAMVQLGWIRYRGGAGTSTAGGATPPPPCPSP